MAPPASKAKSLQNGRKRVVQPVLPALPILSKPQKQKPAAEVQNSAGAEESGKIPAASQSEITKHKDEQELINGQDSTKLVDGTVNHGGDSTSQGSVSKELIAPQDPTRHAELSANISKNETDHSLGEASETATTIGPSRTNGSLKAESIDSKEKEKEKEHLNSEIESEQNTIEEGNQVQSPITEMPSLEDSSLYIAGNDAPEVHVSKQSSSTSNKQALTSDSPNGSVHFSSGYQSFNSLSNGGATSPQQSQTSTLPSISAHLLQLSATKEWADWVIQVHPRGAQPFISYAHGLVLSRSIRLRRLMEQQQRSSYTGNIINLYPLRPVIPYAFETALRFLYSDSVLPTDTLFPGGSAAHFRGARTPYLDYVLSYWATGVELGLQSVTVRAEQLFADLLDWDVAEIAIRDAMNLILPGKSSIEDQSLRSDYENAGRAMIRSVLQFLAMHIDVKSFRLDNNQSNGFLQSRLSQLEDPRPRTNPALASMVFGSMPSSANMSPSSLTPTTSPAPSTSFPDTVASNILLNIDFADLKIFSQKFMAMQDQLAAQILADVVEERENRRLNIILNRGVSNKQRLINSATWDVVGYREFFTEHGPQQEKVGFLLPTKN